MVASGDVYRAFNALKKSTIRATKMRQLDGLEKLLKKNGFRSRHLSRIFVAWFVTIFELLQKMLSHWEVSILVTTWFTFMRQLILLGAQTGLNRKWNLRVPKNIFAVQNNLALSRWSEQREASWEGIELWTTAYRYLNILEVRPIQMQFFLWEIFLRINVNRVVRKNGFLSAAKTLLKDRFLVTTWFKNTRSQFP